VPLTLGLGVALMVLLGLVLGLVPLVDLENIALAGLLAFPLALLVSLRVLGVRARDVDPRSLERVPERAKPLALFALWLFLGTLLFAALGQVLTDFIVTAPLSYGLGLAAALLLVEGPFVGQLLGGRKARRSKEQEIEARLRAEMGLPLPKAEASGGKLGKLRRGR
jgi:hypothetical protein